jgi:hypothetical protein
MPVNVNEVGYKKLRWKNLEKIKISEIAHTLHWNYEYRIYNYYKLHTAPYY